MSILPPLDAIAWFASEGGAEAKQSRYILCTSLLEDLIICDVPTAKGWINDRR